VNRFQGFSIGLVLLVIAIAAALQLIPADPVMRRVSIAAVAAVCLIAAMVFFLFAVKDKDRE
jgi:heme/copper-type cytochrome/quinol oxidase subunit 4